MVTWKFASAHAPALGRWCMRLLAVSILGGCTASVSTAPPSPVAGSTIMDWTINNSRDPAQCVATGAATFNVKLYSSGGTFVAQWAQDCTAFATTIDGLVPDTYTGQANLLDSRGAPRTTTVALAPFTVLSGTAATLPVDFPANSFY